MCRAKDKENRRCGCDSSEKRRLRYGISLAKRMYNFFTSEPVQPNFYPDNEDTFTVESIEKDIYNLYNLKFTTKRTNEHLIEQDRKLNTIGAGIEYLAATKYGCPTDEQLVAAEDPAELLEQRNEAYRKALMDVGVTFANPKTVKTSPDSDEEAVNGLKNAVIYYPQTWIAASNDNHKEIPLVVSKSADRGHYHINYDLDSPVAELAIRTESTFLVGDSMTSNAVHEFAHRIADFVPSINFIERTFLFRRAGHITIERPDGSKTKPEKLSWIDSTKTESGFRDNFAVHYMGKVYEDGGGGELFSTGMEALFTGKFGGLSGMNGYNADPDLRKFLLGALASSARKDR